MWSFWGAFAVHEKKEERAGENARAIGISFLKIPSVVITTAMASFVLRSFIIFTFPESDNYVFRPGHSERVINIVLVTQKTRARGDEREGKRFTDSKSFGAHGNPTRFKCKFRKSKHLLFRINRTDTRREKKRTRMCPWKILVRLYRIRPTDSETKTEALFFCHVRVSSTRRSTNFFAGGNRRYYAFCQPGGPRW